MLNLIAIIIYVVFCYYWHNWVDLRTLFLLICLILQKIKDRSSVILLPIYGVSTYQGVISVNAIRHFLRYYE